MRGGCVKGMPTRLDNQPGSGCRRDCLHRAMVLEYREVKALHDQARKLEREAVCNGYATEGATWDAEHPQWGVQGLAARSPGLTLLTRRQTACRVRDMTYTDQQLQAMPIVRRNEILDDLKAIEEENGGTWWETRGEATERAEAEAYRIEAKAEYLNDWFGRNAYRGVMSR